MKTFVCKVTSILFLLATTFSFANHQPKIETSKNQTIKVALLLDTSNSMDG